MFSDAGLELGFVFVPGTKEFFPISMQKETRSFFESQAEIELELTVLQLSPSTVKNEKHRNYTDLASFFFLGVAGSTLEYAIRNNVPGAR